jgi:hypothetical protein
MLDIFVLIGLNIHQRLGLIGHHLRLCDDELSLNVSLSAAAAETTQTAEKHEAANCNKYDLPYHQSTF